MKKILLTAVMTLIALLPGRAAAVLPDSMLTLQNAYAYTIIDLDTSLAIIRQMRQQQKEPAWLLNLGEGDVYMQTRQMRRAIPCYEEVIDDPAISDSVYMAVSKRLMDVYDLLQDDSRLMYYIFHLKERALQSHNDHFTALADFMTGKRCHYHGDTLQGYAMCRQALEMMNSSTNSRRINELRAFYAELVKMYTRDGRYDEAMQASLRQEALAREKSPSPIRKLDERALRRVFALRASLLAKAGRTDEADAAYGQWLRTGGGNPIDDREILDYLICCSHYEEARAVIGNYCDFLNGQGDSISYAMLNMIFNDVQVLIDQNRGDDADHYLGRAMLIADSLHVRASRSQMDTTYRLLEEQKTAHHRSMIISWLLSLLVLIVVMGGLIIYYNRLIAKRNKTMLTVLNGLQAYRNVNIAERAGGNAPAQSVAREGTGTPVARYDEPQPHDEDERLFVEMDRQLTSDRLFLNPDLSRDDLMRLIGVDKNRFGRMMTRFASNASIYINTKRVEYGAELLRLHPDYTIAYIAESCGLRNTVTFNRIFKKVYGVTPSEYRTSMDELQSNGGGKVKT